MTSNVYIARGEHNGIAVMKVGKANDVRQRVRQLGLFLELSIAQADEAAAFAFEGELRFFMSYRGGKTLPGKNDWFYFDWSIFIDLCATVAELYHKAINYAAVLHEPSQYYGLLGDEKRNAASAQRDPIVAWIAQVEEEKARLKEASATKQKRIEELTAEVAQWRVRYEALKEELEAKEDA